MKMRTTYAKMVPELGGEIDIIFRHGLPDYRFILKDLYIDPGMENPGKIIDKLTNSPNLWFSLMYLSRNDTCTLIGFFYGNQRDNYIEISSNYQGSALKSQGIYLDRGLCRLLAGFTFSQVIRELKYKELVLQNVAGIPGCICYVQAATDYGLMATDMFDNDLSDVKRECVPSNPRIATHLLIKIRN